MTVATSPLSQEDHAPGVGQDGGHVGGDEVLAVAQADGHAAGVAQAGGDQAVGPAGAHDDNGVRAVDGGERAADGRVERPRGRRRRRSSASSIRWGMTSVSVCEGKRWPFCSRSALSAQVVLDDAVVDNDDLAVAIAVGVGVFF